MSCRVVRLGNTLPIMTISGLRLLPLASLAILLGGASGSQSETRTFVIRTDADTVAAERVTVTANTLIGDLHLFEEGTDVHYTLHLRSDGSTGLAQVVDEKPNFFTGTILFGNPDENLGQAGVAGRVVRA